MIVNTVEVGTLVLDIIDAKSKKLVWRGWEQGVTGPYGPEERMLEMARNILSEFPPLDDSGDY